MYRVRLIYFCRETKYFAFFVQVLQLTGYTVTSGSDFKLFSILCALSFRITALEYVLFIIYFAMILFR